MVMVSNKKHWHLYVLKLEHDKYYVGITSKTVEHRFMQHKNGFAGAAWTKKYKPISILDSRDLGYVTDDEAKYYENIVVRKYIHEYGIENVRGGDLVDIREYIILGRTVYMKDQLLDVLSGVIIGVSFTIAMVSLFNLL
jgi:predicted GIY-YIG superfamily endonuclease